MDEKRLNLINNIKKDPDSFLEEETKLKTIIKDGELASELVKAKGELSLTVTVDGTLIKLKTTLEKKIPFPVPFNRYDTKDQMI